MMNLRGYLEKHLVTVDFPPTFLTTNFPVAASIFDSISLSLCVCVQPLPVNALLISTAIRPIYSFGPDQQVGPK